MVVDCTCGIEMRPIGTLHYRGRCQYACHIMPRQGSPCIFPSRARVRQGHRTRSLERKLLRHSIREARLLQAGSTSCHPRPRTTAEYAAETGRCSCARNAHVSRAHASARRASTIAFTCDSAHAPTTLARPARCVRRMGGCLAPCDCSATACLPDASTPADAVGSQPNAAVGPRGT